MLTACVALLLIFLLSKPTPAISADLQFQRIDGSKQAFESFHGKPLLVTFWSPTCRVCLKEVPHINQLYRDYGSGEKLEILGLSMYYDRPDLVIETAREHGMIYPVYFDLDKNLSKAFGDVRATPTSFLINSNGEIINSQIGKLDIDQLKNQINNLLG